MVCFQDSKGFKNGLSQNNTYSAVPVNNPSHLWTAEGRAVAVETAFVVFHQRCVTRLKPALEVVQDGDK